MSKRYEGSMMSKGMRWLSGQMTTAAGKTVRYSRGSNWALVKAVPGMSTSDVLDADGALTKYVSRDWLIESADLVLARVAVTPQEGDTITEYDGDSKYVYQVNKVPGSECWDWCGTEHVRYRIHSKQTSTGSAP
jgi:hypothetical protein